MILLQKLMHLLKLADVDVVDEGDVGEVLDNLASQAAAGEVFRGH